MSARQSVAQTRLQAAVFDKMPATPPTSGPGCFVLQLQRAGLTNHQLSHAVHQHPLPLAKLKEIQFVTSADAAQATPVMFRLRVGNVDNALTAKAAGNDHLGGMLAFPLTPTNSGASQIVRVHPDAAVGRVHVSRKVPVECFFTTLDASAEVPFATVLGTSGLVVLYIEHSFG